MFHAVLSQIPAEKTDDRAFAGAGEVILDEDEFLHKFSNSLFIILIIIILKREKVGNVDFLGFEQVLHPTL
jgi:hypothetical protein